MKVDVHFKNGSSRIIDLGEIDPIIMQDDQAMFDYIMLILKAEGINSNEIIKILPTKFIN